MSAIELEHVTKAFGSSPVLNGVDLTVPEGSTTAILGVSGSGKTTLLRVIAGFEPVDAGTVRVAGQVVDDGRRTTRAQHRGIGYVPQEGALFPHLTVAGNIGFGVSRNERSRVPMLIATVGLEGLDRRYPHQLSGGQQQRVSLARALAVRPSVVLLDEPFSSLDASLRADLRRDVAHILSDAGTTTVLVTHDQDEALAMADQVAVLRSGVIAAAGTPRDLYRDPPDVEAAVSIGEANILPASVRGDRARCVVGDVSVAPSGGSISDGPCELLVRPEQLTLFAEPKYGSVVATVDDVQYHGHDALVSITVAGASPTRLLARVRGDVALVPSQRIWVGVSGTGRVWTLDSG